MRQEYEFCGVNQLRSFFAYFNNAHKVTCGRWGNPQEKTPVKPSTVATYHCHLTSLFYWIAAEGALAESPMKQVVVKVNRQDNIVPFTEEQISALLAVAKRSRHPK